jgi:hypothetical protein
MTISPFGRKINSLEFLSPQLPTSLGSAKTPLVKAKTMSRPIDKRLFMTVSFMDRKVMIIKGVVVVNRRRKKPMLS